MLNTILGSLSSGVAASTSSYESIASATGTGSSGTITFSSIPSTYQHLQIRYMAKSTDAVYTNSLYLETNGSGNYVYHSLNGDGSSATANNSGGAAGSIVFTDQLTGADSGTDLMAVGIIDIHDYVSTTKYKTVRAFTGNDQNSTRGKIALISGMRMSTAAINEITISYPFSNFTTNSRFALYGIKGA